MNRNFPHFASIKTILFCCCISLTAAPAFSQFAEITGLGGYNLAETFYTTDGFEVRVSDGATYGGSLAFYPNELYDIAITYTRQEAQMDAYDYYFGSYDDNIPVSINYIMIGADRNQPLGPSQTAYFFGGLNLGTAGLVPKENEYNAAWKFAFDIHAGAKIFPTPNVGIRLQAGINFPVQYFGAAFTVGTGGSGAGVSANSTITQVSFLAGLVFRMAGE